MPLATPADPSLAIHTTSFTEARDARLHDDPDCRLSRAERRRCYALEAATAEPSEQALPAAASGKPASKHSDVPLANAGDSGREPPLRHDRQTASGWTRTN